MQETASNNQPSRGTIIVDSNAIVDLGLEVPRELRSESAVNTGCYLDVLPLLARNGFRVVIPEITSLEIGSIFKDGTDIGSFFPRTKPFPQEKRIKPFLKAAAKGDIPGISVEAAEGPEHVAAYIQQLRDAYRTASTRRSGGRGDHRNFAKGAARTALILSLHKTDTEGFGDDAIVHMTRNGYAPAAQAEPVYVLTSDSGLKTRLDRGVDWVTARELVYGIAQAGLQEGIGARSSATVGELWDAVCRERGMTTRADSLDEASYIDRIRKRPFFKSLEAVAAELKAQVPAEPATQPHAADPDTNSRIARFKAKYKSVNGTPDDVQRG